MKILRSLTSALVIATAIGVTVFSLALVLNGCTDSEQQAQLDHKKQVEEQEAKDKAEADAKASAQPASEPATASAPEPEQTPEAPPQPEMVNVYQFSTTTCECQERSQCGMSFWRCSNGKTYDCTTNSSYTASAVVRKDDYDKCDYESQN